MSNNSKINLKHSNKKKHTQSKSSSQKDTDCLSENQHLNKGLFNNSEKSKNKTFNSYEIYIGVHVIYKNYEDLNYH